MCLNTLIRPLGPANLAGPHDPYESDEWYESDELDDPHDPHGRNQSFGRSTRAGKTSNMTKTHGNGEIATRYLHSLLVGTALPIH